MLYFWSHSCLRPQLPQGNVSKQTAASVTCPMQTALSLKENRFPQRLAPPCSANKEEKRGKPACSNSLPVLFQEANSCFELRISERPGSPQPPAKGFPSARACCSRPRSRAPSARPHDHSWKLRFGQPDARLQALPSSQSSTCRRVL